MYIYIYIYALRPQCENILLQLLDVPVERNASALQESGGALRTLAMHLALSSCELHICELTYRCGVRLQVGTCSSCSPRRGKQSGRGFRKGAEGHAGGRGGVRDPFECATGWLEDLDPPAETQQSKPTDRIFLAGLPTDNERNLGRRPDLPPTRGLDTILLSLLPIRGNHSSNITCITHAFFKSDE